MTEDVIKIPFEKWNFEELENSFGLVRIKNHEVLINWLYGSKEKISEDVSSQLSKLKKEVEDNVETWNEEELKLYFKYPFLNLHHFHKPGIYKTFAQRKLSAIINNIELSGRIDLLIAAGKVNPRIFVCMNTKKKEERTMTLWDRFYQLCWLHNRKKRKKKINSPFMGFI